MIVLSHLESVGVTLAAFLGAVSATATVFAHLPLPAKVATFFARVGVASGKFAVQVKPAYLAE